MFDKILIANRGEIAVRIIRACHDLGIKTVAVHSTADENAMHVQMADESVCIGPPSSHLSYLNIPALIAACEITGADAVHPGYGFMSENADFCEILQQHNIGFIGPDAKQIRQMGDKIEAKKTAKKFGLPVTPGSKGSVDTIDEAIKIADDIGYPIIIKAKAGGGGRGMKVARTKEELREAYYSAKTEAKAGFGDDDVYMEKFLDNPRHIEIQVFGDAHGNAIHLGERECSLQRRHQKVLEEALSPALDSKLRKSIGEISAKAIREIGYKNAGTIEYLYQDGEFYFIEMNTRLQVEHPVTELITGLDLVEMQIKTAMGESLAVKQKDINFSGHAIECRINAEDHRSFIPCPGTIEYYHAPSGPGVRVDSAVYTGYKVPQYYDSMLGKLIVYANDRASCLKRLQRVLDEFIIEGIHTTIPLFKNLVTNKDILEGNYNIKWLENYLDTNYC